MYFIYKHIRLDNNEIFYVGIGTCKNSKTFTSIYKRAFEKSNRNKFWNNIVNKTDYKVEIIDTSNNLDFIKNKEIELIKEYGKKFLNTGTLCNISDGGEGSFGCKRSEDHKRKMLEGRKKIKMVFSDESKKKMSLAKKGKKRGYDIIFTEATRKKMSESGKGRFGELNNFFGKTHSEETRIKMGTPVEQYDRDGNFIEEFYSLTQAQEKTNSDFRLIQKVCKGERKTHNNFIWKYKTNQ